jgi:Ankyrin repeats (3 copies)/Ankyrin repeat
LHHPCTMADLDEQLWEACGDGELALALSLLDMGANIETSDCSMGSPIMIASQEGHLEVVKMLHSRHANVNFKDTDGDTPLIQAAAWGHGDVVTFLAAECGADVNAIGSDGVNALMTAAYNDRPDMCVFLISRGVDPSLEDDDGWTAISYYGAWLDADFPNRRRDEERPPLTKEQKQARVKLLTDARAEYLELQRRKNAITFLQGSGYLLTAAQREARKAEEAQVDTHAKLEDINRSTKEANLKYLTDRVFGEDKGRHLGREIVMML